MTNTKTCPICGKLLGELRVRRYASAITCGFEVCSRTAQAKPAQRGPSAPLFAKRYANDPVFKENERRYAREQYRLKRLAAGKTVTPRARPATERTAVEGFLSTVWQSVSGALTRAARAFGAFCSG